MATTTDGARSARVGRPRANPKPSELAPAEEILDASARLFSTLGYTTTTLQEPQIFYRERDRARPG